MTEPVLSVLPMDQFAADTAWDSLFTGRADLCGITDLSIGAPGPDILARLPDLIQTSVAHSLERGGGAIFQYGPEVGIAPFRSQLARFLNSHYGDRPVLPSELVVTSGATSGLQLAASVLIRRQGIVFVEDPTYFIAQSVLGGDLGLKVVSVPMDGQGIDVAALETAVHSLQGAGGAQDDGRFWAMVYTIPNFHNPTGLTTTKERGRALIQLATEHNMLLLCDDVYNLLRYKQRTASSYSRLRALDSEDNHPNILSNGSLSKVLAPGMRLGWLEASPHIVSKLVSSGFLQSGGSMNNFSSGLVTSMLSLGLLDSHLAHCTALYGARMDSAVRELQSLPPGWSLEHPGGGYFLWVRAPTDLTEFCAHLRECRGVVVLHGARASSAHWLQPGQTSSCSHCFRLSIAYCEEEQLVAACRTVRDAATEFFQQCAAPSVS